MNLIQAELAESQNRSKDMRIEAQLDQTLTTLAKDLETAKQLMRDAPRSESALETKERNIQERIEQALRDFNEQVQSPDSREKAADKVITRFPDGIGQEAVDHVNRENGRAPTSALISPSDISRDPTLVTPGPQRFSLPDDSRQSTLVHTDSQPPIQPRHPSFGGISNFNVDDNDKIFDSPRSSAPGLMFDPFRPSSQNDDDEENDQDLNSTKSNDNSVNLVDLSRWLEPNTVNWSTSGETTTAVRSLNGEELGNQNTRLVECMTALEKYGLATSTGTTDNPSWSLNEVAEACLPALYLEDAIDNEYFEKIAELNSSYQVDPNDKSTVIDIVQKVEEFAIKSVEPLEGGKINVNLNLPSEHFDALDDRIFGFMRYLEDLNMAKPVAVNALDPEAWSLTPYAKANLPAFYERYLNLYPERRKELAEAKKASLLRDTMDLDALEGNLYPEDPKVLTLRSSEELSRRRQGIQKFMQHLENKGEVKQKSSNSWSVPEGFENNVKQLFEEYRTRKTEKIRYHEFCHRLEPGTVIQSGPSVVLGLKDTDWEKQYERMQGFLKDLADRNMAEKIHAIGDPIIRGGKRFRTHAHDKWAITPEASTNLEGLYKEYVQKQNLAQEIADATKNAWLGNPKNEKLDYLQVLERLEGHTIAGLNEQKNIISYLSNERQDLQVDRLYNFMVHLTGQGEAIKIDGQHWLIKPDVFGNLDEIYRTFIEARGLTNDLIDDKLVVLKQHDHLPEEIKSCFDKANWPPKALQEFLNAHEIALNAIRADKGLNQQDKQYQEAALQEEHYPRLDAILDELKVPRYASVPKEQRNPALKKFLDEKNEELAQIIVDHAHEPDVLADRVKAFQNTMQQDYTAKLGELRPETDPKNCPALQFGPKKDEDELEFEIDEETQHKEEPQHKNVLNVNLGQRGFLEILHEEYCVFTMNRSSSNGSKLTKQSPSPSPSTIFANRPQNDGEKSVPHFVLKDNKLILKVGAKQDEEARLKAIRNMVGYAVSHGATSINLKENASQDFKNDVWKYVTLLNMSQGLNIKVPLSVTPETGNEAMQLFEDLQKNPQEPNKDRDWVTSMRIQLELNAQARENSQASASPSSQALKDQEQALCAENNVVDAPDGVALKGTIELVKRDYTTYIKPPQPTSSDPNEKPILFKVHPDKISDGLKRKLKANEKTPRNFATEKKPTEGLAWAQRTHQSLTKNPYGPTARILKQANRELAKIRAKHAKALPESLAALKMEERDFDQRTLRSFDEAVVEGLLKERPQLTKNYRKPSEYFAATTGKTLKNIKVMHEAKNGDAYVWEQPAPDQKQNRARIFIVSAKQQEAMRPMTLQRGKTIDEVCVGMPNGRKLPRQNSIGTP